MDLVSILRELWSRRRWVAGVCFLAVLAATLVMYKVSFPPKLQSRQHDVGVETSHILVNTPNSQILEVAPRGTETLSEQTLLLASLMVDGAIKSEIAKDAGLPPSQIVGVNQAVTAPSTSPTSPPPVSPPSGRNAYVLSTQVLTDSAGDNLPIIQLQVQAPTSAAASKLTAAATTALGDYLNSQAAVERVPDANRLQVSSLGTSQPTTQVQGPSSALALVIALVVFALGCACILGVPVLVRRWRAASTVQVLDGDSSPGWASPILPHGVFPDQPPAIGKAATARRLRSLNGADEDDGPWLDQEELGFSFEADDDPLRRART